jgi:hypothetical protein
MSVGLILLLVCIGAIIVVWWGLGGIEVSGSLAAGLICVTIGASAIRDHFWPSLAFIVVGAVIFLYAIRSSKALKEFSTAICVGIALVSGFYAINYLT